MHLFICRADAVCELFARIDIPCPPVEGICSSSAFESYVKCDGRYSVVGLNLSTLGIAGTLPSSFTALTALSYLNLSGNFFTGPFPEYISNFSALSVLALCLPNNENCSFSSVPLSVSDAPFGGPLSSLKNKVLGNLTSLEKGMIYS